MGYWGSGRPLKYKSNLKVFLKKYFEKEHTDSISIAWKRWLNGIKIAISKTGKWSGKYANGKNNENGAKER